VVQTLRRHDLHCVRDRYEIHREMSTTAALKFADGSLDFVYLDALHSYRDCMNDILAWFPKVYLTRIMMLGWRCTHAAACVWWRRQLKVGGLLAGDDYWNSIVPLVSQSASNGSCVAHCESTLTAGTRWGALTS
jgi:hypothetical protein